MSNHETGSSKEQETSGKVTAARIKGVRPANGIVRVLFLGMLADVMSQASGGCGVDSQLTQQRQ